MSQPFVYPARSESKAPHFDPKEDASESVPRYFDELDDLFAKAEKGGKVTDMERIERSVFYLPGKVERLWKSLEEYETRSTTAWKVWKETVVKQFYPEAEATRRASKRDLEKLVATWKARGFGSVRELGEYWREYSVIRFGLVSERKALSAAEADTAFQLGFPVALRDKVRSDLALRAVVVDANRDLEVGWTAKEFFEQACRTMGGGASGAEDGAVKAEPGGSVTVKQEATGSGDIAGIMKEMFVAQAERDRQQAERDRQLVSFMQGLRLDGGPSMQQHGDRSSWNERGGWNQGNAMGGADGRQAPPHVPSRPYEYNTFAQDRPQMCYYCAMQDHMIRSCPYVAQALNAGNIQRIDGQLCLPNGVRIGRDQPGASLRDKVSWWHETMKAQGGPAPSNQAAQGGSTATSGVQEVPSLAFDVQPVIEGTATTAGVFASSQTTTTSTKPVPVTAQERAMSLLSELDGLGLSWEDVQAFKATTRAAAKNPPPREPSEPPPDTQDTDLILGQGGTDHSQATKKTVASAPLPPTTTTPREPAPAPEHPFAKAVDANYAPDFDAVRRQQQQLASGVGARALPPVYDRESNEGLVGRIMGTPVNVTIGELLSASPDVSRGMRTQSTPRRQPMAPPGKVDILLQAASFAFNADAPVDFTQALVVSDQPEAGNGEEHEVVVPSMAGSTEPERPLDHGTSAGAPQAAVQDVPVFSFGANKVILNPTDPRIVMTAFEREIQDRAARGEVPTVDRLLKVADTSAPLRLVPVRFDNRADVDCIYDPGSAIISMSESTASEVGLAWNTKIRVRMQSANGEYNLTSGLAENVPMTVGGVVFYVQVHVIASDAYAVLLGRPFDLLTESEVKNFADGRQRMTLTDPNTGRQIAFFTRERGAVPLPPPPPPSKPSFQISRN